MTIRSFFPTFIAIYRAWRARLSPGGKALTAILFFSLPALGAPDSPLAALFCATLALLAACAAANRFFRPRLVSIKPIRIATTQCEPTSIVVTLKNDSIRSAFDMNVGPTPDGDRWGSLSGPQRIAVLEAQEEVRLGVSLQPRRRGVFQLPNVKVTSEFPLNLFRRSWKLEIQGELIAYPGYTRLESLASAFEAAGQAGERLSDSLLAGQSADYSGSREYQPGVSVRRWDYASWARVGSPAVREFGDDRQTQFAVVLDPYLRDVDDEGDLADLEAAISLAAAIADWLLEHDCRIAVLALGEKTIRSTGEGWGQLDRILEALAGASPQADSDFDAFASQLPASVENAESVLYISTNWDARRQSLRNQLSDGQRPMECILVTREEFESQPGVRWHAPREILDGREVAI